MDTGGLILLLIVAVCIAILIVVIKKNRDLEESKPADAETSVPPIPRAEGKTVAAMPQNEGPPQKTIYEYRPAARKCLCTNCDGENEWLANFCYICGEEIKKGVN